MSGHNRVSRGVPHSDMNAHTLGAKVGPRVAKVVTDAMEYSLFKTRDERVRQGADAANLFFHGINRELQNTISPLFHRIAEHDELHPEVRGLAQFVARQPGEGSAFIGMAASMVGYGSGVGTVIANLFAPVIQRLLAADPLLILPTGAWVDGAARRLVTLDDYRSALARQGLDDAQANWYLSSQLQYCDPATLLELLRRGTIDHRTYVGLMERNGYADDNIPLMEALTRVHLSPANLSDMVVRGILDEKTAAPIAAKSGIDGGDFALLVRETGEPIALMQLLEAYRRGFVDQDRLTHGVRQSRIKDEWMDVILKLRHAPMGIADAARAVVQNYMDEKEADGIAEANGLEPGAMKTIIAIQGEPPGHQQMLELLNRGEVAPEEVRQSFRESHLKDKYIDTVMKLRRRLLPERTVVMAHTHNALTDRETTAYLGQLGISPADAQIVMHASHAAGTGRERELAKGDIVSLYVEYAIDRPTAAGMLADLHYPPHDVDLILHIADFRRTASDINKVVTAISHLYIGRWITEAEARSDLAKLGAPAARIDHMLPLWTLDRDVSRKHLTEGQVIRAVHQGVLTQQQALGKLEAMGYSAEDATILVKSA